ncbi:hypothetical protein PGB90_005274 [Kerria lacca]
MALEKIIMEKQSPNNPLDQFVLLAKGVKGAAAAELIKQTLDAPGVYVFGELLDMPSIKELENGHFSNVYQLLQIFAHGTYKSFLENKDKLPHLSDLQQKKLQHLTIVSLATKMNCIPYSVLLNEVDIKNVRDLEDLIIDAIYADIIRGKLDQKNSYLEVDFAIGRDFKEDDLMNITETLKEWCESCESVLSEVDSEIVKANAEKSKYIKHKTHLENEVTELKKNFKSQNDEVEDLVQIERLTGNMDKPKKLSKQQKMCKSGGKFWPRADFMRK